MIVLGIDAHKQSHTVVAVDEVGKKLAEITVGTTSEANQTLMLWALQLASERLWAIEDCRNLSRRLERELLRAGEQIVRVTPKMMASSRNQARTFGKSDPIDALAVARAALREPNLPRAQLDGKEREIRLLADHREDLVAERTRMINRLRWHLHEIDPTWKVSSSALKRCSHADDQIIGRLIRHTGTVARIARDLVTRCRELSDAIAALEQDLAPLVSDVAPSLMAIPGCGVVTAAKIIGETANVLRFRSRHAYAKHNGTAPIPVWSSNTERFRLSRIGNRQLNSALFRIAFTQARCHAAAREYLARRTSQGNSKREAMRCLKRKLSDVVYATLRHDAELRTLEQTSEGYTPEGVPSLLGPWVTGHTEESATEGESCPRWISSELQVTSPHCRIHGPALVAT